jgi:3-hydroxyacyl-CoA dehydrogenase
MGSGIAEVCARAGLDVTVREIDDAALAADRARAVCLLGRQPSLDSSSRSIAASSAGLER